VSGHTTPIDRRSVLCLTYPAFGHVLPVLPVIAELARREHQVTVTAGDRFVERLRGAGADPVVYRTALTDDPPPESVTADEMARRTLHHVEETLAVADVVEEAAAAHGTPDVVVHDTTLWAPARVLAHRWGAGLVQVVPTLASNEHFSITERLGRIAPPVDPAHPAIVRVGERLGEFALAHGVAEADVPGVLGGEGGTTLVTVPRAFQVCGETFGDDHVFVGPCADPAVPDEAPEWAPSGTGPVALISLGTTVNDRPELFLRIARAFAGTDWQVVMTVGGRVDPDALGPLPANVEVHRWLPHAAVLRHAEVFVCQGGMGSVQESLQLGVPMVVVAHHHEQQANSERIAELGLGVPLDHATLTAESVRAAVDRIVTDPGFASRVAAMGAEIRAAGGAPAAADAIEAASGVTSSAGVP
jgi:MGT family glycosyltransferase